MPPGRGIVDVTLRQYGAIAFSVIRKKCRESGILQYQEAEEIYNEWLYQCLLSENKLSSLGPKLRLRRIFSILRNCFVSRLRKETAMRRDRRLTNVLEDFENISAILIDHDTEKDKCVDYLDFYSTYLDCVSNLNNKHLHILRLLLADVTQREMANKLGIPVGTVNGLIKKAKQRISVCLKHKGVGKKLLKLVLGTTGENGEENELQPV